VATPGRLLDLMQQGFVRLKDVEVFVLDEADRMLDMGFLPDVRRVIAAVPHQRQTLMFSATMPPDIQKLADAILNNPVKVAVNPPATTVELTAQSVYYVEKGQKNALLQHILSDPAVTRVLVFTRTKHGANKVVKILAHGGVRAEPIHSNKSQMAREKALGNFRAGRTRVLVATDIAARGIDVDNISHVINFDLPNEPETYVHRIGRTGRAGQEGIALSFCSGEERPFLSAIERLIRMRIVVTKTPDGLPIIAAPSRTEGPKGPQARGEDRRPANRHRRGNNGSGPRRDPHKHGNQQPQERPHAPKPAASHQPAGSHKPTGQQQPAGHTQSGHPVSSGRKPARPAPMPQHVRRPRLVR
jgi:ATP-dependent RNA helicase RhlE